MSAEPPDEGEAPAPSGPDLARAALSAARAAARAKGVRPGQPATGRPKKPLRVVQSSGSGPDARDPVLFGSAIRRLVAERGWEDTSTNAGVLANWARLVGPEIADHCQPVSLVDGALVLQAESSAWATQLRLLTRTLMARLSAQVGEGVVTSVVVRAPAQPDWRKGSRRVQGPGARGPRDTYG